MSNRKKIVAGNWKMNLGFDEAIDLVKKIQAETSGIDTVTKIVFPPFPYLREIVEIVVEDQNFFVGAQNCSEHQSGAYTGEVAAKMLNDIECDFVLVGHSERRTYFDENPEQLRKKLELAFLNGLKPVFCFGEHLAERKSGRHFDTVSWQLESVLINFPERACGDLVLAYEPVWAIGTGETASPDQAQEMHAHVRKVLRRLLGDKIAEGMRILYGGSCNAQNARDLFSCPDVDGGLIGGASLKAADFCQIIRLA